MKKTRKERISKAVAEICTSSDVTISNHSKKALARLARWADAPDAELRVILNLARRAIVSDQSDEAVDLAYEKVERWLTVRGA